jgi:uncharacterized membrane protein (DUF485 family)
MSTAVSAETQRSGRGRHRAELSRVGNATRAAPRRPVAPQPDYKAIHDSPEFVALRRRLWVFVFPVGALFVAWYFGYVLLSAYAPAFVSQKVVGDVNLGLILGLSQFVSATALTLVYVRYARKRIDPAVDRIRDQQRFERS